MPTKKSYADKARQYSEMNELEAELEKTQAVLKKTEFQQLPTHKKLAIYATKGLGLGLALGIGFIIFILAFS